MTSTTLCIEGVGFWAPTLPDWPEARAAFRGEAPPRTQPAPLPKAAGLPPAEARRSAETTALALAVSASAIEASGHPPGELLAVFASAHGDLPAIDQVCDAVTRSPLAVSPTRFLHTVHNAPMGVWSMLSGNGLAHNAVSAADRSFATGLLEAAMLAATEQQPVLLVGYDTAATGGLVHTAPSRGAMAVALVLSPQPGPRVLAQLHWHLAPQSETLPEAHSAAARQLPPNGMSQALPFFEALASGQATAIALGLSGHQQLHLTLSPPAQPT